MSVIICKRKIGTFPGGGLAYITKPDPLYLWACRLLLERISWYIRDHGGGTSIVTFSHLKRFKTHKLHEYRQALLNTDTKIHWPSFAGHPFRFDQPNNLDLLQVADTSASALWVAIEPDQYGVTEDRYLVELSPKIYRRPSGSVTSYGLKCFPSGEGKPGGSLAWLSRY